MNKKLKKFFIMIAIIAICSILSSNVLATEIEFPEHSTLLHTKKEIKEKSDETSIKLQGTDILEIVPSIQAPYTPGKLKAQAVTDTLNQINYYRWLAGLNSVTLMPDSYMERAQKGAVLLAASEFSHFPNKPSDMDSDFYEEAKKATSGITNWNEFEANMQINQLFGNISAGEPMADSIKGFIDDVYNIEPNVGHRLSHISPRAKYVAFGYVANKSVVDFFGSYRVQNPDLYTAWPAPGNFPVEAIDARAMWSIALEKAVDDVNYVIPEDMSALDIKLKANGKTYSSKNNDFIVNYTNNFQATYFFKIPNELKAYLTDGKSDIQNGKKVEIEIYGITDENGTEHVIKYPVNFFSLDNVLTNISLPESATIKLGSTRQLEILKMPLTAIPDGEITWKSSNPNIATVDINGHVLAKAEGEVVITAEVDGLIANCTVKVVDFPFILGDVNEDGKIKASDAVLVLKYVAGNIELTDSQKLAADTSKDGKVKASDAVLILKYVAGNITHF